VGNKEKEKGVWMRGMQRKETYNTGVVGGTFVGSEGAGLARFERSWGCGCEGGEGGEDECDGRELHFWD